jgi:hypothetical protein
MRTVAHARVSPTSSSRPSTSASALARRASFRVAVRGDTARDAFFALGPARPRARRAHAAPRAFLWWSREKELRKRWKQLADFAADEIPESSPLARSKGLIQWGGEYPLTAASAATAIAGGVSALISAAVLPVVVGVAVLALPGLLFAFVGTAAVASLVGALVLLLSLPALGFLSVFGGTIAAAASAKLLPIAIIGSGLLFGANAIKWGMSGDARAERLKAGADVDDDAWSPRNVNAVDDTDESSSSEDYEETVKRNFDARLRALDEKKKK